MPISIRAGNAGWMIRVKNVGPGLAQNLKIKTRGFTIDAFDPIKNNKVWINHEFSLAEGPLLLMPNQEAEYLIKGELLSFDDPFYITWKSITGKVQKSSWTQGGRNTKDFITYDSISSLKWKIKFHVSQLWTPVFSIIKWLHFRKTSKQKNVLNDEKDNLLLRD